VTTLRIDADRNYTYGGTFQDGRPKLYYLDSSTYWGFQEPIGGYDLRRGTPILGQEVLDLRLQEQPDGRFRGPRVRGGG